MRKSLRAVGGYRVGEFKVCRGEGSIGICTIVYWNIDVIWSCGIGSFSYIGDVVVGELLEVASSEFFFLVQIEQNGIIIVKKRRNRIISERKVGMALVGRIWERCDAKYNSL